MSFFSVLVTRSRTGARSAYNLATGLTNVKTKENMFTGSPGQNYFEKNRNCNRLIICMSKLVL